MSQYYPIMTAILKLNLTDALNPEELEALISKAANEGKSLERVIYEAAIAAIRPQPPIAPAQVATAA